MTKLQKIETTIVMNPIAYSLCLALTLVQLSSCQSRAPFDSDLSSSFFPLSPGSTWTYRIVNKAESSTEIFTDRAIGLEHARFGNVASGLVSEDFGSDSKNNFSIRYTVEDGYVTPSFGFGDRGQIPEAFHLTQAHRSFLETALVLVPAGDFSNCIRIETETVFAANNYNSSRERDGRRLRYVDWYAPNVGLIKTLVFESGLFGKEIARVELLSFGDPQNILDLKKTVSHSSTAN